MRAYNAETRTEARDRVPSRGMTRLSIALTGKTIYAQFFNIFIFSGKVMEK